MKKKLIKPEIQEQSEENVLPFSEGGGSYSNSYTGPTYFRGTYADEEIDDISF